MKMMIDIQMSFKKIKDFKSLEIPIFNDKNEDAFRYVVWNLYHRVSEAIKSFIILFENKRYYDSFIIAGHCLETCAILSYIKDNPTYELCRERYNKYLASATLECLKYDLAQRKNLEEEITWQAYVSLLNIFKTVDINIIKKNQDHEEAINLLYSREGLNKDKIKILKDYYYHVKVDNYIQILIKNTAYFGGEDFDRCYEKYCNIKHSNMIIPGASFETNSFEYFAEEGIMLILGIMYYLKDFKF